MHPIQVAVLEPIHPRDPAVVHCSDLIGDHAQDLTIAA
jgi:hypothetical protein